MESSAPQGSAFQARTRKSTRTRFYWTSTWEMAIALLAFGPRFLWDGMLEVTLVAFGISIATGLGLIIANKKHLKDARRASPEGHIGRDGQPSSS